MANFHSIKDKYFINHDQLETEASVRIQLLFWDAADQTQGLSQARQVFYLPATTTALGFLRQEFPIIAQAGLEILVLLLLLLSAEMAGCVLACQHLSEKSIKKC